VLVQHAERVAEVDAALRHDVGHGGEAGLADVEEGNDLGVAVREDVAREAAEGGGARAPRVHDGRHARVDPTQIGMHAAPREALEDVGVEIDEAGGDDLAPDVHRARGLRRGNARSDAGDDPALHRNVLDAAQLGRRIDDRAALEQEIVHVRPPMICGLG
jgi:hypothetical protein